MGVSTDMVFRLLALDEASATFKKVAASADESAASVDESNSGFGKTGPVLLATAAAAAVVAVKCIDMAAKFQAGMETMVTGAGESQAALGMVSSGVLNMAVPLATSTQQLTDGLYHIESAGVHGQAALNDLKIAAEGAKIGNADLDTMAQTMVGTMNSFGTAIKSPTSMMNMLISTVSNGDMKMQDLGSSLGTASSTFASAKIPIQQYLGAIATMTAQNVSAQESTNLLGNLVNSLSNPTNVATKEMAAMGLSSNQVAMDLGKQGLTGTLSELTTAILKHMGPAGTVLQSAFESSTQAAANAKTEISTMPANLQKVAQAYLSGSVTTKQWSADLKGLDPIQKHLMQQFATTAKQTDSFNSLLTAGGPAAQTYNAALSGMTGGVTGLQAALKLTGANAEVFQQNVEKIGAAGQKTTGDVTGWSEVTKTLSFKLDQAREVIETLAIRIGTALIPVADKLVTGFTFLASHASDLLPIFSPLIFVAKNLSEWWDHDRTVMEALGVGLAAVGTVMLAQAVPAIVASSLAWGEEAIMAGAAAVATLAAAAPFIAIGVAVAALAFGFLELIKHWSAVESFFKTSVHAVSDFFVDDLGKPIGHFFTVDIPSWFDDGTRGFMNYFYDPVKSAVGATIGFFENDLIDPIGNFFTKTIPSAFQSGYNFFKSNFVDPIKTGVTDVEHGFDVAFNAIPKLVSSAFSGLVGIVKLPINGVIDLVDDVIGALDKIHVSIPSWVPGVGGDGFGISIPQIPRLADGGLVLPQSGGTQVTVAEAGQPEIVSPLPALQQVVTAALNASQNRGGYGMPDQFEATIAITMDGAVINRQLVKFRRAGGVFTAAQGT